MSDIRKPPPKEQETSIQMLRNSKTQSNQKQARTCENTCKETIMQLVHVIRLNVPRVVKREKTEVHPGIIMAMDNHRLCFVKT